jgi:VWFA-related protein
MNRKHGNRSASIRAFSLAFLLIWMGAGMPIHAAGAQQTSTSSQPLPESPRPQNNAPQNLPEAPSATAPPAPAPSAPLPKSGVASPADLMPNESNQSPTEQPQEPAPKPIVKTMPPGSAPGPDPGSRQQLWILQRQVNFVTVPVSVKDRDGHLVEGLLAKNFSLYEDGVRQNLKFFSSDPFPLSAAVVIDLGMSDQAASKVRDSLPALIGAFGQFDEVSIFTYGNTVKKWQDITPADKISTSMLRQLKAQKGGPSGAPVVGGPLGQSGPVINGRNMDNTPNIPSMPGGQMQPPSKVLNDAILAAAQNLARRDRMRRMQPDQGADYRKILFVISDGRELGSVASYADVMQVLLTNNITVYAIGVGGAAIPGYRKLATLNLPMTGVGNILPKYTSATGGQVYSEFGREAIESAYSRVTSEARNQYTLGYTTRATPSSAYRSIEVRVNRPGLRVYARDGYYPLPPPRPISVSEQP